MTANYYLMFPVVENGMDTGVKTTGMEAGEAHLEANIINLKGAWVSYELDGLLGPWYCQGEDDCETHLPDKVWIPTSGSIKPKEQGSATIDVIPPNVGVMLDNDAAFDRMYTGGIMTATVTLVGRMGDGTDVTSPEFLFPIRLCRGCLIGYDVAPWECCYFKEEPDYYPCFPGQDDGYSCQIGCELLRGSGPRWLEKWATLEQRVLSLGEELPPAFVQDALTRHAAWTNGGKVPDDFDWEAEYAAYKEGQQAYADAHSEE